MTQHTPGPWTRHISRTGGANYACGYILAHEYGGVVARVHSSNPQNLTVGDNPPLAEAHANGLLIAAAPDLLELAQSVLGIIRDNTWETDREWLRAKTYNAIAKATTGAA